MSRGTDHLATVTAALNSFQHITLYLQKTGALRAYKAETRKEAPELLREVQKQSFLLIEKMLGLANNTQQLI